MASPEPPEETVGAEETIGADAGGREAVSRLPADRIELPVYQPRERVRRVFWCTLVLTAVATMLIVWLLLA
jgi:hypothetical protein